MNQPQFKIFGTKRRELKKELSNLKSYIKLFWFHHTLEKDMDSFIGGNGYVMSDELAKQRYDSVVLEIESIENLLSIPYTLEKFNNL